MKVVFAFLLLTYVLASSDWGFCPNVSIQADFDFERHTGNWYEIVKSKNLLSLEKGSCGIEHYTQISPFTAHVQWTEILPDLQIRELNQTLTCNPHSAQCSAKFSSFLPGGDYKVIATDYDNYTMIYSCLGFGVYHVELLWIMGRNKSLPEDVLGGLIERAKGLGFGEEELVYEDVSTCDRYNMI